MRTGIMFMMIMGITGSAIAQDLGPSRELPVKNTPIVTYEPPAEPRQGGDTIEDATVIPSLPFTDTGTLVGYTNDYFEACPYSGSVSPDVVYSFTPDSDVWISVDLCGSTYDTQTYIYDEDLNRIACNTDFYFGDPCGVYVSKIEYAELMGGEIYFIIVDGCAGDYGDYILNITEPIPCEMEIPADAVDEGEPELHYGYLDAYNGGCNSPEFGHPFQDIDWTNDEDGFPPYEGYAWLRGTSGWFFSDTNPGRDTDWYRVFALHDGVMEFTVQSEFPCYMFKLAPLDCETVDVDLQAVSDCSEPQTLAFPVTAGEEIWLWVGPAEFLGLETEFPYFMTVSNNTFDTVPAEGMSWGRVKSLYR